MDRDEYDFRLQELDLRKLEVRKRRFDRWAAGLTAAAAVVGLIVSINFTTHAQQESARLANDAASRADNTALQDHFTLAQANYNTMIGSLDAKEEAVRVLSVRRLVQFVQDTSNYREPSCARYQSAVNLLQALEILISEKASKQFLVSYKDTAVASETYRLSNQLEKLTDTNLTDQCSPGSLNVYLDRQDFHGVPFEDWAPDTSSNFSILRSDFRMANLKRFDLSRVQADFTGSYLTCANLQGADFGTSNVQNVDFTGAHLEDANLASVKNLNQPQLAHASTNAKTLLPPGLSLPSKPFSDSGCTQFVADMPLVELR